MQSNHTLTYNTYINININNNDIAYVLVQGSDSALVMHSGCCWVLLSYVYINAHSHHSHMLTNIQYNIKDYLRVGP